MDFWTIVWALLFVFVGLPIVIGVIYLIFALIASWYIMKKYFNKGKENKK